MKKLSLSILAIAIISLVACKKDRTCTCTITYTSGSPAITATGQETTKFTKVKKSDVRDKCLSYTQTSGAGVDMETTTYSCTLAK